MQPKAAEILMLRIEALEGRRETDLQRTVENSSQKFEAGYTKRSGLKARASPDELISGSALSGPAT
jgi:hypothetical protein